MAKTKGCGLRKTMKIDHIEAMAQRGMTRQQIGAWYGVTGQRIGQLLQEYPELDEAFDRGLAKGIDKVTAKLWELIEEKNVVAILFFLKCQAKWMEQQYVKEKEVNTGTSVRIFLPHNGREPLDGELMDESFNENISGEIEPT